MSDEKKAIPSQKRAKRRRKPTEVASRKQAIRNFCLECVGYESAEVIRCCSTACWLHPYRLGSVDKKEIADEKGLLDEFEAKQKDEAARRHKVLYNAKKAKEAKRVARNQAKAEAEGESSEPEIEGQHDQVR